MFALLGQSLIGVNPLTAPQRDTLTRAARFVRHDVLRGPPVLQDLGHEAETRRLTFFFDEAFCDPQKELRQIEAAFEARMPMQLVHDAGEFQSGIFVIERLQIKRQKTDRAGRVVRVEIGVDLVESKGELATTGSQASRFAGFALRQSR